MAAISKRLKVILPISKLNRDSVLNSLCVLGRSRIIQAFDDDHPLTCDRTCYYVFLHHEDILRFTLSSNKPIRALTVIQGSVIPSLRYVTDYVITSQISL